MKALLLSALLTISAFSGTVQTHGDHGAISESGAMNIATRVVQKMTLRDYGYAAGQLDASWESIGKDQIVLKEKGLVSILSKLQNPVLMKRCM